MLNRIGKKAKTGDCGAADAVKANFLFPEAVSIWKRASTQKVSGDYQIGTVVEHKTFGRGKVKTIMGEGDSRVAVVDFYEVGERRCFGICFAENFEIGQDARWNA